MRTKSKPAAKISEDVFHFLLVTDHSINPVPTNNSESEDVASCGPSPFLTKKALISALIFMIIWTFTLPSQFVLVLESILHLFCRLDSHLYGMFELSKSSVDASSLDLFKFGITSTISKTMLDGSWKEMQRTVLHNAMERKLCKK